MRCPYCAEEIKHEAIFCRYCRHDLTFFKMISPLQDRVSSLEESLTEGSAELEETKASLHELRSGDQAATVSSRPTSDKDQGSSPVAKDHLSLRTRILIVVLVGLGFSSYIIPLFFIPKPGLATLLFFLLTLAAPVVGGGWVGANWRGKHLRSYALLGSMAGVIPATIMVWLEWSFSTFPASALLSVSIIVAIFTLASTTLLFVTGGLLGDRIEKRRSGLGKPQRDAERQQQVQATARRITGSDEGHSYKAIVEIQKVLLPLIPVVTGLLGIVTSILSIWLGLQQLHSGP